MILSPSLCRVVALGLALALAACTRAPQSEAELLASARGHLERRDTAAATIDLKAVLQQYPQSGQARLMFGRLLLEGGDAAGARVELERAAELNFSPDAVLPPLAAALVVAGEPAVLIERYGSMRPANAAAAADFLTHLARAHQAKGAMPAAEAAVDEALQRVPAYAPALLLQVQLAAAQGERAKAQSLLDALLASQPQLGAAWALQGELLMNAKPPRGGDAIAAFRKALGLGAEPLQAHSALLVLLLGQRDLAGAQQHLASMKAALPNHPETRYFEAILALQAGEPSRVRELTQALLANERADDVRVLTLAGQAEMALNSTATAEALLLRALQAAPNAVPPRQTLAQLYLGTGQATQALAAVAPLLDAGVDHAQLWVLKGRAQLIAGDAKGAEESLKRAARLRPDDRRVLASVAILKLGQGQNERAMSELEAISRADSGVDIDLALISTLMGQRKFDAALGAIDALAKKNPASGLSDLLRARIALQRRDAAGARKHFEAGLTKEPQNFALLAGLSALDVAERKLDAAFGRYEALLAREPGNVAARLALAEVAARAGGTKEAVAQLLQTGVEAAPKSPALRNALISHWLAAGQTAQALTAAQAAVAALPDHTELLDRLGRLQAAQGQRSQALDTFGKLAIAQPRSALPHLRMAEVHIEARDEAAAGTAVRAALKAEPGSLPAQRAAIRVAMREGQPAQALAIARKVQTQRANEAIGHLLEGEIEFEQRSFDAAATAFRKAQAKSDTAEIAIQLHRALQGAGKAQEAQRLAEQWLKAHPQDASLLQYLGDSAQVDNRLALAETHYREAIRRAPDNVLALNNLAYLLARQQKPSALPLAERAVKLAPDLVPALDTLALAYANGKQFERALQTQRRAVELAPKSHGLRLSLARLQVQAGDHAGAREELRKLAALGKDFRDHEEVGRLLKAAGG